MIEIAKGNLLRTEAEALVNTVNCVGFMGKGIALQFRKAYPENFKAYQRACRKKEVVPGTMFIFKTNGFMNPRYIINFPTKRHWRGNSRLADIESGLKSLITEVRRLEITSIAVPPLGCGLGGLDWNSVRPMIEKAFESLPDVHVYLYEPTGAPDAKDMPVRTKHPHMTKARALYIKLMKQYSRQNYRLTLLEIQKLAYFLQEAGEPLKLKYDPGIYGPYATNLNHVLEIMEGHFTRGYGDIQKPDVEIELLLDVEKKADEYLGSHQESNDRLDRVLDLIEGFETPYGMELLSSVHWVAFHNDDPASNADDAIRLIHNWNDRKRKMFHSDHIRIAWDRLVEEGWLGNPIQS